MSKIILFLFCAFVSSVLSSFPPKPTADVLAWTNLEIGMMYSYGMVSMMESITNHTQYFCYGVGGTATKLPPASLFNPEQINLDNWLDAAVAIGAKYAVLVAQHCGGFSTWPTDIEKETGFDYKYSIKYSPLNGGQYDLVGEFIKSCKNHNILPGIYYSLNENFYLNVGQGKVRTAPLVPGQANVTQDLYGKIVLAQMKELWSNYGPLAEIWFDGGCSVPGISDAISDMLYELQPHAVYFGGCAKENNIRWVGTESGMPGYPLWSNSDNCNAGLGSSDGNTFCPAESDTTLQVYDNWFWRSGFQIRSLSELKTIYMDTVGHNTNLLLNAAPTSQGLIADLSMQRYKEFGEWIQKCFGEPVVATTGRGNIVHLISGAGQPFRYNKIVIQEDQTNGQAVNEFSIYDPTISGTTPVFSGDSIGHKLIVNVTNVESHELILNITKFTINPVISHFGVYYCP